MYFAYGEEETDYLKKKDKRMAEVIDRIGHVERKVDTDLFSAVVHHIVGQQISTKAPGDDLAADAVGTRRGQRRDRSSPRVFPSSNHSA